MKNQQSKIRSIIGTIAVLLGLSPLVLWAAQNSLNQNESTQTSSLDSKETHSKGEPTCVTVD